MMRYSENALPMVTDAQRDALVILAAQPDECIDVSEIPEITAAWMNHAVGVRFYRLIKKQIIS